MRHFAGIDWASAEHAVCVIDEHAKVLYRAMVAHTREGLADLVRALRKFGPPAELPVAIERPSGLLVDTLVDAGFPVVPIHPNVVKASTASLLRRARQDRSRRRVHARRPAPHRRPPLPAAAAALGRDAALRALVRTRDDLVAQRVGPRQPAPRPARALLAGRRRHLRRRRLAHRARLPRALPDAPERRAARREAPGRLPGPHAYCGRRPARSCSRGCAPRPSASPARSRPRPRASSSAPSSPCSSRSSAQLQRLTAAVEHAVDAHPDGALVTSLPAAAASTPRRSSPSSATTAPASLSRGPPRRRGRCRARHPRVRQAPRRRFPLGLQQAPAHRAIVCFADNSRHTSAWAAAVYQRARDRGCDHPHAIRILARAWLPRALALEGEDRQRDRRQQDGAEEDRDDPAARVGHGREPALYVPHSLAEL